MVQISDLRSERDKLATQKDTFANEIARISSIAGEKQHLLSAAESLVEEYKLMI